MKSEVIIEIEREKLRQKLRPSMSAKEEGLTLAKIQLLEWVLE